MEIGVNAESVGDIVPNNHRTRWLSGEELRDQLADRAADPALARELDAIAGQTLPGRDAVGRQGRRSDLD
jgi:hypothetical protein